MAEFINTSEGFLNLAHILWVKFGAGGEEGFDLLQMTDGRLLKCQIQDPLFKPSLRNRVPEPKDNDPSKPRASSFLPGFSDPEQTVSPADGTVNQGLQVQDPGPQKP